MTPGIVGFVTREQAGLAPPTSISRVIEPHRGGVAVHWGGPGQPIRSHADCYAVWRSWQRIHMLDRGFVDVAYTGAVCDHGYAFAGRGAGIRTAANGTDDGNLRYYAVAWLGGAGQTPSARAIDAAGWWVVSLRTTGGAGTAVLPHSALRSTTCPGDDWRTIIRPWNNAPIGGPTVPVRDYAQAVVGVTPADIEQGRVLARAYALGLVQAAAPTRLVSISHPGYDATVRFAFLIGKAASVVDPGLFPDGTIEIAGIDRNATAEQVAETLLAHHPATIARRGRPW